MQQCSHITHKKLPIAYLLYFLKFGDLWQTAAVIPVFITGRPVITKWGDYSTFNIPIVVVNYHFLAAVIPVMTKWGNYSTFEIPTISEYLSEQLLGC